MVKPYLNQKFQAVYRHLLFSAVGVVLFVCPKIWASQVLYVVAQKALVFSDPEMSKAIGLIKKGKQVTVGEKALNGETVYPIFVEGKISFIRASDLSSTPPESDLEEGPKELLPGPLPSNVERFRKLSDEKARNKFVLSYFNFQSKINQESVTSVMKDDEFLWQGLSIKGEVLSLGRVDFQIMINLITTSLGETTFRASEFGAGFALRLLNFKYFLLRAEAQVLGVPFASYEVGDDFRARSFGYTLGAGLNMTIFLSPRFGLEVFGGPYRMSLGNFKAPSPYSEIKPTFSGQRFGAGLNFSY